MAITNRHQTPPRFSGRTTPGSPCEIYYGSMPVGPGIIDCDGNCTLDGLDGNGNPTCNYYLGDGNCLDGYQNFEMCSAFGSWADSYQFPNFNCAELNYSEGGCTTGGGFIGDPCIMYWNNMPMGDGIIGCNGCCHPPELIGDGNCHSDSMALLGCHVDFMCPELNYEGGDCPLPPGVCLSHVDCPIGMQCHLPTNTCVGGGVGPDPRKRRINNRRY
jgi:hypothetical protein